MTNTVKGGGSLVLRKEKKKANRLTGTLRQVIIKRKRKKHKNYHSLSLTSGDPVGPEQKGLRNANEDRRRPLTRGRNSYKSGFSQST